MPRRTRAPDASEFAQQYRAHRRLLEAWARRRILAPLRAQLPVEDFLQETWARAYLCFPEFDPARGSFGSWLMGIAYRVLSEQLRNLRVRQATRGQIPGTAPAESLADPATSIVSRLSAREQRARLRDAVAGLDQSERRIVAWRSFEGLPYAEIGARLGISAIAAESRWRRAVARLQAEA